MTLPDYLRLVATQMEKAQGRGDHEEMARLARILNETLTEKNAEFEAQR